MEYDSTQIEQGWLESGLTVNQFARTSKISYTTVRRHLELCGYSHEKIKEIDTSRKQGVTVNRKRPTFVPGEVTRPGYCCECGIRTFKTKMKMLSAGHAWRGMWPSVERVGTLCRSCHERRKSEKEGRHARQTAVFV